MPKGEDKRRGKGDDGKTSDKLIRWAYRDHDDYNWAGQKTADGADVRRKGSDR